MKHNIFHHQEIPKEGEIFKSLLKEKNVLIEKILSSDLVAQQEYIQDHDEWVILLEGKAEIFMEDQTIGLNPGDYLFIKSQTPHKVVKTSHGALWLAVHIH